MNCKCGVDAILLEVRKESPNKGKKFYTCKSRACDFFQWQEQQDIQTNRNIGQLVQCSCGKNAAFFEVRKEGPNKGRKFFTCKERTCDFFKWQDDKKNDDKKDEDNENQYNEYDDIDD